MKNGQSKQASSRRSNAGITLNCNVVVEPSSIDFLNEGAVFVAGSQQDCGCGISPMPELRKGHRRGPTGNKR
ncbi:hypothetical protein [Variovorax sp. AFSI2.2]|uniref:hypothetical protein n=1 Tax=Variovorax sp. AFSI2.2 TaxID=3384160 RepID=UPI003EB8E712